MSDLQEQLAELRRRVARIDKKFAEKAATPAPPLPNPRRPERYFTEEWMPGREVETEFGRHYEFEKLYERHRRHGSIGIHDLEDLDPSLLGPISSGEIINTPPAKWCFLDTETTGLAGGAGTYAFLIGVGRIASDGFRVRQFFMREFCEEASLLSALSLHLAEFDVVITYNGRTYDQPLIETRYLLARARTPFGRLHHLDLLWGARRLWKLRFESCRLVDLENRILGVERHGDLPGEMIPYVYFEYLRTQEIARLYPIFHHNQIDILTLACLTAMVPLAFHDDPSQARFGHGAEMVGLARWWRQADQPERALALFRQAVERHLPDALLFRTLWDIAALEKKLGNGAGALAVLTELAASRNPFQGQACEELAKHYEHREKNHAMALQMTLHALAFSDAPSLHTRAARLQKRLQKSRSGKLGL